MMRCITALLATAAVCIAPLNARSGATTLTAAVKAQADATAQPDITMQAGNTSQPDVKAQAGVTGSELFNNGWKFHLGNAADMMKDFTHGTEYFTCFAKARSSDHSHSPVSRDFSDSTWQSVNLPHDWAVDLPYSSLASHSHGYKCIGWRYPENSVGWYRKWFHIPLSDRGKRITIEFEGIFRDSEVYCNGFYLGHERSGYSSAIYDLTDYLTYGGDNLVTVRCDASTEEGWYYEGAGIYRNVRLHRSGPVSLRPYSLAIIDGNPSYALDYSDGIDTNLVSVRATILDKNGNPTDDLSHKWTLEDCYLYTLKLEIYYKGELSDVHSCKFGMRDIEFSPERGFLLNGEKVDIRGCNLHLDHAGVGVAIPDELWRYRILQLKKYGFNAIRCSHNPASPAMLDLCDALGMLVIDENREIGTNREQLAQMVNMIERDRNHPCIILWSIGNEEWAVESDSSFVNVARKMSLKARSTDPTRPTTYGSSGGREFVKGVDVFGYNYVVQNPVLEYLEKFPGKTWTATEETTGCGTRGKYTTDKEEGWMAPINRTGVKSDRLNYSDEGWSHSTADGGTLNVIERGWKFYRNHTQLCGVFYWTGFDYRGEPNPMAWPATGSQFGVLDYCGFPKDEAFYLKSSWTGEPVLHICGPCNGEVWVYSNCDEVELFADGRSLGRQTNNPGSHLWWKADDNVRKYTAKGYTCDANGTAAEWNSPTVLPASYPEDLGGKTFIVPSKTAMEPDGQDIIVLDIYSDDNNIPVEISGAQFLGWGNGNPGFKEKERPENGRSMVISTFSGRAQVILRSIEGASGKIEVRAGNVSDEYLYKNHTVQDRQAHRE